MSEETIFPVLTFDQIASNTDAINLINSKLAKSPADGYKLADLLYESNLHGFLHGVCCRMTNYQPNEFASEALLNRSIEELVQVEIYMLVPVFKDLLKSEHDLQLMPYLTRYPNDDIALCSANFTIVSERQQKLRFKAGNIARDWRAIHRPFVSAQDPCELRFTFSSEPELLLKGKECENKFSVHVGSTYNPHLDHTFVHYLVDYERKFKTTEGWGAF